MSKIIQVNRLIAINLFDLSPKFSFATHVHDDWEFIYVDSGSLGYISDGIPGKLRQGEIIFHPKGVPHSTVCDGRHSVSFYNIIFSSSSQSLNILKKRCIKVPDKLTPLLRAMIAESERTYNVSNYPLKKHPDAPSDGEQILCEYLELFLLLLRRHLAESEKNKAVVHCAHHLNEPPADEICQYLKAHLSEKISLDMLAEHFHLGKTQLCVGFKKRIGTSIVNYFLDLKIAEAKRLLREENISVSNISGMLGFESPEYFSRCFKNRVGHSPMTFRKMLISGPKVKK